MSKIENKPIYICLTKSVKDEYAVLSEKNGKLIAFKTLEDAIQSWEGAYDRAFGRGLPGATGATLGHMALNPSIVYFKNIYEMKHAFFIDPPFELCELYSWNYGIKCQKDVSKYWEEGTKPELVKEIV